jgi:hypothetical protein
MSVSGMSGWERGLGAQTFANMNWHFEQEPSFAGQTWRYLGGREPSLDTSLASFAVPVYRGSDAGEGISDRTGGGYLDPSLFKVLSSRRGLNACCFCMRVCSAQTEAL